MVALHEAMIIDGLIFGLRMAARLSAAMFFFLASFGCATGRVMNNEGSLTYLALGDSYTIGEGVAEDERWPVQLAAQLREAGVEMAEPVIIARTGWTTGNLLSAIEHKGELGTFDLVSLLIGVNNQYQGLSLEAYRAEFKELLGIAISAVGGRPERVIVLSIPDWGYTPFASGFDRAAISASIDAFNAVNREESEAAGVHYVDITPSTRPSDYTDGLFAFDGLHPSGAMYALWVEQVIKESNLIKGNLEH
jgi:lysophospholipase L1-like esterase